MSICPSENFIVYTIEASEATCSHFHYFLFLLTVVKFLINDQYKNSKMVQIFELAGHLDDLPY